MLQRAPQLRPLRVLVATPGGTAGQGGIDRVMATLKAELERRQDGRFAVGFAASRGTGHVALSPFYLAAFLARMVALRAAGRLDLVHINLSNHGSTLRKLVIGGLAIRLGVPYVIHLHAANYDSFWRESGYLSRRLHRLFRHARRIVVLGRVWRDLVARRAPETAGNIVVIPNATPFPALPRVGGGATPRILFLGRIGARKGVPQLLAALDRLKALPDWRATLAGDGAVDELRAELRRLGLGERVSVPGWVGPETVARLIASADILALPSFAEGLPVSVIEGMAAGLAVIATPVGAVEDIIADGETGLLVPPGDVDALCIALGRLIADPALRRRLGSAAMARHRERLSLDPFTDAICAAWTEAATMAVGVSGRAIEEQHI